MQSSFWFSIGCSLFRSLKRPHRLSVPRSRSEPSVRRVAGLSSWRTSFDPRPYHVRFVVHKVAIGQVSLPVFQFPLSVSFHQCSTLQFPLSVSFHQCSTLQFPLSVSFHHCSTLQFPLSVSFHHCSTLQFPLSVSFHHCSTLQFPQSVSFHHCSTLQFPQSVSFHQCSTLIFIYMLLLPGGQNSEVWEPSKKQCSFRSHWALNRKVLPRCFRIQITWEDLVSLLKSTVSTSSLLAAYFSRLCDPFPIRCSIRSDCTDDGRKSPETLRPSSCEILKRRRGLGVDILVLPASPVALPVPHTLMWTATGLTATHQCHYCHCQYCYCQYCYWQYCHCQYCYSQLYSSHGHSLSCCQFPGFHQGCFSNDGRLLGLLFSLRRFGDGLHLKVTDLAQADVFTWTNSINEKHDRNFRTPHSRTRFVLVDCNWERLCTTQLPTVTHNNDRKSHRVLPFFHTFNSLCVNIFSACKYHVLDHTAQNEAPVTKNSTVTAGG